MTNTIYNSNTSFSCNSNYKLANTCTSICGYISSAGVVYITLEEYKEYNQYKTLKEAAKSLNKNIWELFWLENN